MMYGYGYDNYFGGFGWIMMIFWWVLIGVGVIALVRWVSRGRGGCCGFGGDTTTSNGEKTPVDILKERYAKGEIDKKEFEEKVKEIKNV